MGLDPHCKAMAIAQHHDAVAGCPWVPTLPSWGRAMYPGYPTQGLNRVLRGVEWSDLHVLPGRTKGTAKQHTTFDYAKSLT